MGKTVIYNVVRFLILVLLQAALFKNIGYYNLTPPFPYILFIFLLPIGLPNLLLYLIAFITGLSIDAFYDTLGIHAAACVALALFRILFHKVTLEVDMKDSFNTPTLAIMGAKWYLSYIFFGTITHHLTLFLIEIFSFNNFLYTLASIVLSSIFTVLLILLITLLFYKRKTRISNI